MSDIFHTSDPNSITEMSAHPANSPAIPVAHHSHGWSLIARAAVRREMLADQLTATGDERSRACLMRGIKEARCCEEALRVALRRLTPDDGAPRKNTFNTTPPHVHKSIAVGVGFLDDADSPTKQYRFHTQLWKRMLAQATNDVWSDIDAVRAIGATGFYSPQIVGVVDSRCAFEWFGLYDPVYIVGGVRIGPSFVDQGGLELSMGDGHWTHITRLGSLEEDSRCCAEFRALYC